MTTAVTEKEETGLDGIQPKSSELRRVHKTSWWRETAAIAAFVTALGVGTATPVIASTLPETAPQVTAVQTTRAAAPAPAPKPTPTPVSASGANQTEPNPVANDIMWFVFGAMAASVASMMLTNYQRGKQMNAIQAPASSKNGGPVRVVPPDVKLADFAGYPVIKREVTDVVDALKFPQKYTEMGAKVPKGVLLFGPPGTGKTLLARCVAGEAAVPFFYMSGSEFVEMYVGVGAKRVRELFDEARKSQPCIVFIDEIDAIGKARGSDLGSGNSERDTTLNQLLTEMDGFQKNQVIVMAATNKPEMLDPALLRRLTRKIMVDNPDIESRKAILAVHARGKKFAPGVDPVQWAAQTIGASGDDLAKFLNEAAFLAARDNKPSVDNVSMQEAYERLVMGGPKRDIILSEADKRAIAIHEGGHAMVGSIMGHEPVKAITIVPRGMALGAVVSTPDGDRVRLAKREAISKIMTAVAGRAAELMIYGRDDVSGGCSSDLSTATNIAEAMVCDWGMSELPPMRYGHPGQPGYNQKVAEQIEKISMMSEENVNQLLDLNREFFDDVVQTILDKEVLDAEQFAAILQRNTIRIPKDVARWMSADRRKIGVPEAGNENVICLNFPQPDPASAEEQVRRIPILSTLIDFGKSGIRWMQRSQGAELN